MATFIRGLTVTVNSQVTAQTLHSLIESATFQNLAASDFVGGARFPVHSAATPNASISPFWLADDHTDPVFRVFATPFNIWLTFGPDRFEIPLYNSSATTALRGAIVVSTGASSFGLASNASINSIGFLQADTAPGAWGPVATMGIGWALFSVGSSGYTDPVEGRALIARGTPAGTVTALDIVNSAGSGPMFGQFLESDRSGFSGSYSVKRVHIWGPKLTTGF